MKSLDSAPLRYSRDTSYGRLLRRLNQAMDVASTRHWMTGQQNVQEELEVQGLTYADVQLLTQILHSMNLDRAAASPTIVSARNGTQ